MWILYFHAHHYIHILCCTTSEELGYALGNRLPKMAHFKEKTENLHPRLMQSLQIIIHLP
jgi:hypothetical protein